MTPAGWQSEERMSDDVRTVAGWACATHRLPMCGVLRKGEYQILQSQMWLRREVVCRSPALAQPVDCHGRQCIPWHAPR